MLQKQRDFCLFPPLPFFSQNIYYKGDNLKVTSLQRWAADSWYSTTISNSWRQHTAKTSFCVNRDCIYHNLGKFLVLAQENAFCPWASINTFSVRKYLLCAHAFSAYRHSLRCHQGPRINKECRDLCLQETFGLLPWMLFLSFFLFSCLTESKKVGSNCSRPPSDS